MLIKLLSEFKHYIGIAGLLVLAYFLFGKNLPQPGQTNSTGTVAKIVQTVKDPVLAAALHHETLQLSEAQRTIDTLVQQVGHLNPKFSAALTTGLTRPHPTQEVITAHTDVRWSPPPPAATDSQIKKDMKEVLAQTTVNAHTTVDVKYQDKPTSPFFAAYATDGASGLGYSIVRKPRLSLDLLVLGSTDKGSEFGPGVSHDIKGTDANLGIAALYNLKTKHLDPRVYVGIRF